ncbi:MAG: deoxynucleoside kinase [Candidatus Zixiibacteriota bacterium]|nr:MAG: deoxynucleoside kinase [candidate division Zixibacteria bacterium]
MSIKGYIAVEGPIGVGKTTLAKLLAKKLDARLILENSESNPFLPDFYKNRERYAFQTQIFFLMSRSAQQQHFAHDDLFSQCTLSDYIFAKDGLFAGLNLSSDELILYEKVTSNLEKNVAIPDMVIYLTATVDTLIQRIRRRQRSFEKGLEKSYLENLCETYSNFFFNYSDAPLLVVKTDNVDFSTDGDKLSYIIEKISNKKEGTEYISFDSVLTDNRMGTG